VWALNARAEHINKQSIFLTGFNTSYQWTYFLKLRANVQRSYRAPTLNEWYYLPGGNINLKPEKGWSEDLGYEIKLPFARNLILSHDVSVFNRQINDWILWFGGSIWTPHNIAQVHSRGVETMNSLVWKRGVWQYQLGLNTSFVLATTTQSYVINDGSIGKQIPYSPRYNGQLNVGITYRSTHFNYNHTYTGYRFVTVDESQFLTPYQTGNIYLSHSIPWAQKQLKISIQVNNVWNYQYQVVNMRPMPTRNWSIGVGLSF
jgi:iron complex outermembrane receptor protein